jgi:hypothetical protein
MSLGYSTIATGDLQHFGDGADDALSLIAMVQCSVPKVAVAASHPVSVSQPLDV